MPEIEKEKLARDRWWHEDNLINHRLNWLLTAQIALFAGYGWIIEKITETGHDLNKSRLNLTHRLEKMRVTGFDRGCRILNQNTKGNSHVAY